MARDDLKNDFGTYDIQIIEIVVDYLIPDNSSPTSSDLTFPGGQLPKGMVDYTTGSRSFFYHSAEYGPIKGFNSLPMLERVNVTPQTLFPGRSKGTSEKFSCSLIDFPHDDRGIDPWVDYRSYNPLDKSTYWRKWLARFPYITGRTLKYHQGYIGRDGTFDLANNFLTREYSIESAMGPSDSDIVTIQAFDSLNQQLAEKRAVAPLPSTGLLNGSIDNSQTTITLDDTSEYPTTGVARIDEELIDFTVSSGTQMTVVRGQYGTTASSHDDDSLVQICIYWNNEPLQDAVYSLCTDYGVDLSAKITKADWDTEKNTWMAFYNLTGFITEPTEIQTILGNMMNTMPFYIFEDVEASEIKFVSLKPPRGAIRSIDEEYNIIDGSVKVVQKPEDRVSRILYYYAPKSPFTSESDEEEWDRFELVDADAESASQYGQKAIKKVFNRFFDASNLVEIRNFCVRAIDALRDIPKEISFGLDEKDEFNLSDVLILNTYKIVDGFGNIEPKQLQIVQKKEDRGDGMVSHIYKVEQLAFSGGRYGYIGPDTLLTYTNESEANKANYAFIADDTPELSNGDPPYLIL